MVNQNWPSQLNISYKNDRYEMRNLLPSKIFFLVPNFIPKSFSSFSESFKASSTVAMSSAFSC